MLVRAHNFHLVDRSAWRMICGVGCLNLTLGGVLYAQNFVGGIWVLLVGFLIVLVASIF